MPGFTPEPPGSQQSFALQHKPQSERPLLRGSTPTTCQFNYNTTNIYYNGNTSINIIRPHPATLAPGGFRRARNALNAPWRSAWVRPSHGAANARHGQTLSYRSASLRSLAVSARVACAAWLVFQRALAIALSGHSYTHTVVRFANPPAQPREETEDNNDSLPPLRFPSAPRGSPHPPPRSKP
jgi:hypothetical protein